MTTIVCVFNNVKVVY